jgi:DNA replication licensing factor MCM2
MSDDEGEGEDLRDTMDQDYKPDVVLDTYDTEVLGEDDIDENLDAAERRAIEEELDRRDMAEKLRDRDQDGDVVDDEDDDRDGLSEGDSEDDEAGDVEVQHLAGGNVKEWITEGRKRKAVKRRFKHFLLTFEAATGEQGVCALCMSACVLRVYL